MYISDDTFDKPFHLVALYENDLIRISMNINENFKNERKFIEKLLPLGSVRP